MGSFQYLVGSCVKVVRSFISSIPGELRCNSGDVVYVYNLIDDWIEGTNLESGLHGKLPISLTTFIETGCAGAETVFYAKDSFQTSVPDDLTFIKGQFIVGIKQIDENWWQGEISGRRGIFPLSFVTRLPSATTCRSRTFAVVKTHFVAQLPDELNLVEGETVEICQFLDKSWCRGRTADGREGIFPIGFVHLTDDAVVESFISNDGTAALYTNFQRTNTSSLPSTMQKNTTKIQMSRQPCIAKYPFVAECHGELGFNHGEVIYVTRQVDAEWSEGENVNGKRGIFPASFVEIRKNEHNSASEDCATAANLNSEFDGKSRFNEIVDRRTALYDFVGGEPGDLSVRAGEKVLVLRYVNAEWIEAVSLSTDCKGILPANFLSLKTFDDNSSGFDIDVARATNEDQKMPTENTTLLTENQTCISKTKPPRPAAPRVSKTAVTSPPPLPASSPAAGFALSKKEGTALTDTEQRNRIIAELIQTEREYIHNLEVVNDILRSTYGQPGDLSTLVFSFPSIIGLSHMLLQSLEVESKKLPTDKEDIGTCFISLGEKFFHVYGAFCDRFEETRSLLDPGHPESSGDVNESTKCCMQRIRERASCIDMNSAISRPIQRILKYPLFLKEILKYSDQSGPDGLKLRQALDLMTDVAKKINEAKHRKELVQKYVQQTDSGVVSRLVRLNMHSVRKKGSRISMRISSTLGIAHVTKDEQFEKVEHEFRTLQKFCQSFLKSLKSFCEQLQLTVTQEECLATTLSDLYCGDQQQLTQTTAKVRDFQTSWKTIATQQLQSFVTISTNDNNFAQINADVRKPVLDLQKLFDGPEVLIEKRADKLLDYDATMARVEKAKHADPLKLKLLLDAQKRAQADYEALNSQLLSELPLLIQSSNALLEAVVSQFFVTQRSFYAQLVKSLTGLEKHLTASCLSLSDSQASSALVNNYLGKQSLAFESLVRAVPFLAKTIPITEKKLGAPSLLQRGDSTSKRTLQQNSLDFVKTRVVFPQKAQTDAERKSLCHKYPASRLFVITRDHTSSDELELKCNSGDIVYVIVNKDPMGNSDRYFVDNGVAKGFVCRDMLVPFAGPFGQTKSILSANNNTRHSCSDLPSAFVASPFPDRNNAAIVAAGPSFANRTQNEPALIDLSDSASSDLTKERPKSSHSHTEDLVDLTLPMLSTFSGFLANDPASASSNGNAQPFYQRESTPPAASSWTTMPSAKPNPLDQLDVFGDVKLRSSGSGYSQQPVLFQNQFSSRNLNFRSSWSPTKMAGNQQTTQPPYTFSSPMRALHPQTNVDYRKSSNVNVSNQPQISVLECVAAATPWPIRTQKESSPDLQQPIRTRQHETLSSPDEKTLIKPVAAVSAVQRNNERPHFSGGNTALSSPQAQTPVVQASPAPLSTIAPAQNTRPVPPIPWRPVSPIQNRPLPPEPVSVPVRTAVEEVQWRPLSVIQTRPLPPDPVSDPKPVPVSKLLKQQSAERPVPVRAAPLPPAPLTPVRPNHVEETEFYVVEYDFVATGASELSISENQVVAVLQKCDMESNPDWWLVLDDTGQQGFVPANYLRPL